MILEKVAERIRSKNPFEINKLFISYSQEREKYEIREQLICASISLKKGRL